jgi:AcrR family transcriptional regulator
VTTTASHPATEQRIHLAALRLFSRQGYAGTGIRELADEAGLSSASLYNHIGSKEDLLVRIMREGNERLERTAVAALQGVDRPEVRLALLTQVHVFVHGSFRQECRVIDAEFSELNGGQRQVVLDQRDAYEALWASTLQEGADSGALSVPDLRVTRLALLSMCTGVAHWFRPEGPNDVYDISVSHVDLVLATTRATRGRRSLRGSDLPLLDRSWFDLALPDQPDHQARA